MLSVADPASIALTACVTLSGVVAALWRHGNKQSERHQEKLDDQNSTVTELSTRVGRLEGEKEGIERMVKETRAEVREAVLAREEGVGD